jgi:sirohydrochlorin cobaltochelatase
MLQNDNIKMQHQGTQRIDQPAIVITAFGSSKRGRAVFSRFHRKAVKRFPDRDVYWAYTSKIIRQKTGDPGLRDTLAHLQSSGYSGVVVLPLQVFPGVEYRRICTIVADFQDLSVVVGETLMHRWKFVNDVLSVVEKDFLPLSEGLNLLALHGSPLTADPVNSSYLGLERLVADKYENVMAAALEGVPDHEAVFTKIATQTLAKGYQKVRIIPMLLVAGMHVEKDLMGAEGSWRTHLETIGLNVECQRVEFSGESYFKSLTSYPEIEEFYLQRLGAALRLVT